jgi:thioesterase domain-containing protein
MDRKNIEAIHPLSPMQQALLFNTLAARGRGDPGFLQLRCVLEGDLDPERYRRAWLRVMERHAALRSSVHWTEVERPLQVVFRRVDLPWTVDEWSAVPAAERQQRLDDLLRADAERGLELSRAPAMRLALVRMGPDRWQLVWSCHHVLLDGWSGALVLAEAAAIHDGLRRGAEPELPPTRPFGEYVAWLQREEVDGVAAAEDLWRRELAGLSLPTPLPAAAPAGARDPDRAGQGRASRELSAAGTAALQGLARRHRVTLSTLVQGAWASLLSAHSGEAEVCFGATVSGRSAPVPGIESMVGLFINVLPVRVRVEPGLAMAGLLERLQEQQARLRRFEHVPTARIQSWSEAPGGTRLFESLVVFENFPVGPPAGSAAGGLRILDLHGGVTSGYPMTLVIAPGAGLALHLLYDRARFDAADAARLLAELARLLEAMAADPAARVGELLTRVEVRRAADDPAAGDPPAQPASAGRLAPRDALELQLVHLWESVLGVHPIGVRDDFFELGGNSLAAAQLFERVERELRTRLPLATLFQASTVESLAGFLRDTGRSPPPGSLVPMQSVGSRPPLFCVHSYEGHVLFYRDLARRLAPDQPVYGLQAAGLHGEAPPLSSVEEMAAHYLREIRTVQPHGPYLLAGMCFGISVALEMAQQLHARGEKVGALIMLDSGFMMLRARPEPPRTWTGRALRRVRSHAKGIKKRSLGLARLFEGPRQRERREFQLGIRRAWSAYRPRPYPGEITLINSVEWGAEQDWYLGTWSALAAGGLQVHTVPGGHLSFLHEPHARHLADTLRACLDAGSVRAARSATPSPREEVPVRPAPP